MFSHLFYRLLLINFLFVPFAFPNIDKHLKKVEGKSDIHKMRNIDFIYLINLDQRPEKFQKCIEQLYPYGIYPYRFSAVNGWELSLETINDVGLKFEPGMTGGFLGTSYLPEGDFSPHHEKIEHYGQTYFCHCMARGTIGIALSHLSVLQDAYDSGYETIWVMEDDIDVIRDPRLLPGLIDKLDKIVGKDGWDVLFTDRDIKNGKGEYVPCKGTAKRPDFKPKDKKQFKLCKQIDRRFLQVGARYGGYSMILRRSGIEKILTFIKNHKIFLPYDMDYILPKGIKLFSLVDDVVSTQVKALSDNGGPNYLLEKN